MAMSLAVPTELSLVVIRGWTLVCPFEEYRGGNPLKRADEHH